MFLLLLEASEETLAGFAPLSGEVTAVRDSPLGGNGTWPQLPGAGIPGPSLGWRQAPAGTEAHKDPSLWVCRRTRGPGAGAGLPLGLEVLASRPQRFL